MFIYSLYYAWHRKCFQKMCGAADGLRERAWKVKEASDRKRERERRQTGIQIEGYEKKKFRLCKIKKGFCFFWQKNEEITCILCKDGIQYGKCREVCTEAALSGDWDRESVCGQL